MPLRNVLRTVALGFLIACNNPFATRDPDPPSDDKLDLLEPDSATNVLDNFKSTLEHVNDERYEPGYAALFHGDFEFFPDESDRERYDVVFSAPWLKDREEGFAKKLFEKGFLAAIERDAWSMIELETTDDEARYEHAYSLKIDYVDPSFKEDDFYPKSLSGTAWLFLRERDSVWGIYRWEDQKADEEATSWGGLRAKLSS